MARPTTYSFQRYLAAKQSVDDRALNHHVWQSMREALPHAPLRVLEIGAGIGTMAERLVKWGALTQAHYTALDADGASIASARQRLAYLAPQVEMTYEVADLFDFAARENGRRHWDLVIAHAFLDLVDVPHALPQILALLRPSGFFYFSLNFDGATILQPTIDPAFDAHIVSLYHCTMDTRRVNGRPSGDSRTGRHLFTHLRHAGATILAAGSSDWVVFAGPQGYHADEAYFLHFIIHTMQKALQGHPELDPDTFEAWIAQRHAQIEAGTLVYIAHQLDFCGKIA